MQAIDTNVVVRLLVRDDEGRRAEAMFHRAGGVRLAQIHTDLGGSPDFVARRSEIYEDFLGL